MTSDEIREAFLRFFEEKQHDVIPSSSLIPYGDPTMLLTTAGMVQVKPYFLGLSTPPSPRLASCQKCFRTTDIDSVGDAKHLTFFEMLGNFSIGDYFKKEAIAWAWEFITQRLNLPPEKLWVTVYLDDDEAFNCWRGIGFPEERILRFGEEDNFWGPAGDSGPCGPCSEIHYDFGEKVGCGRPECKPDCDCGRFSEIWNLVFTQYNQDHDGRRTLLPKPNIDTGMGLERVVAAIQDKPLIYNTDLFLPLIGEVCNLAGKEYGRDDATDQAIRIIAEHSRGITFLIADGVLPSNEGRGYVLRRILRRACFLGRKLGLREPFLGEVAEVVIEKMGNMYPELTLNRDAIREIIKLEEGKFIVTLDMGVTLAEKLVDEAIGQGQSKLSGSEVFKLYDTYGFSPELTAEIARERNLLVDIDGFEVYMEQQRERARASQRFTVGERVAGVDDRVGARLVPEPTTFVGYDELVSKSQISYILDHASGVSMASAKENDDVVIVLDRTPFYGEMGGQAGDVGKITGDSSQIKVTNTFWSPFGSLDGGAIVHLAQVVRGNITVGDVVEAEVDADHRLDIARNHTATHLLQAALHKVLGAHVRQRGSLVSSGRLRFDFSHLTMVDEQQLNEVQHIVNEKIRQNLLVRDRNMPYREAIDAGAIALFDEKYGETVRVIEMGDPPVSAELCGGTHVKSTGEIGFFVIIDESSIGAGLRRIEAVTGAGAEAFVVERLAALEAIAQELKSTPDEVRDKVNTLVAELAAERKSLLFLERQMSKSMVETLLGKVEQVNGVTVLAIEVPPSSGTALREIGDLLKDRLGSAVIVLGTVYDGKPGFIAMVTSDLVGKGFHAGELVKQVAQITGGSGGGKAQMAQAGGKDRNRIDEALGLVKELVRKTGMT